MPVYYWPTGFAREDNRQQEIAAVPGDLGHELKQAYSDAQIHKLFVCWFDLGDLTYNRLFSWKQSLGVVRNYFAGVVV